MVEDVTPDHAAARRSNQPQIVSRVLHHCIIGLFLLGSVGLFAWFSISKPHILILHSYNAEYSWVKGVNIGLRRILDKHSDYVVRWYYLDTKRHPWPEFKTHAGIAARRAIDNTHPDIIIAIDDDAQAYVSRYYTGDTHIQIVFAGVNNEPETYGFEHAANVTGILERIPLAALKETLLIMAERNRIHLPLRIRFLGDHSETVAGDERYFSQFDWKPIQVRTSRLVDTFAEWQAAVYEAKDQVDFLIVSNYRKVIRSAGDPTLVPPSELIAWTEAHAPVPVIGTNGFFAEENGMFAIGTSPYEQGEVAAQMVEKIISQPSNRIPYKISHQFIVAMREKAMQARHLYLPQVYEAAARTGGLYFE